MRAARQGFFQSLSATLFRRSEGAPDYYFVGGFFVLLIFGLIMLSSASSVMSFQNFKTSYFYITHQLLNGFLPGLLALWIASRVDYHVLKKFAFPLLLISIVLLILVFVPGIGFGYAGAHRWIHVGSFIFQPSELVKLTFLIYIAAWLSNKGEKMIQHFSYGFMPFMVLLGSIGLLIMAQPDMGTMGVIVMIAFSMYFVGGASMKHVAMAGLAGIGAFAVLVNVASYRLQRFMTFLHPELDPLGVGYHINQALLAVGSGGIFGRGFGHSRQKFAYLPEAMTDSIFAVIAEELGLLFCVLFIVLIVFLAMRGFKIARRAPDSFGMLMAVGIVSWFTFQAFINIGAMLSLLPLTGIPLPFVSYGGTALLVAMTAVGILINISRQRADTKRFA